MMSPHAVKRRDRYKAAIKHRSYVRAGDCYRERVEILGTRHRVTDDGRDTRIDKAAPGYATREAALEVARRSIEQREARRRRTEKFDDERVAERADRAAKAREECDENDDFNGSPDDLNTRGL